MMTSTRLALAATVIALILFGLNPNFFGQERGSYEGDYVDMGQNLIFVLLGIWALKFILGSLTDNKTETK